MTDKSNSIRSEPVIEPPLVDFLCRDRDHDTWVITFIPEMNVSARQKEMIEVPVASNDGRRIGVFVAQIARILGKELDRVSHGGEDAFTFFFRDGTHQNLADAKGAGMDVYDYLWGIAQAAQRAFRASQLASA